MHVIRVPSEENPQNIYDLHYMAELSLLPISSRLQERITRIRLFLRKIIDSTLQICTETEPQTVTRLTTLLQSTRWLTSVSQKHLAAGWTLKRFFLKQHSNMNLTKMKLTIKGRGGHESFRLCFSHELLKGFINEKANYIENFDQCSFFTNLINHLLHLFSS